MSMGVTLKGNQRILSITNLTQSENVFRRCVAVIPYFLCKSFNVNSHISAFKVVTNSQSNYGGGWSPVGDEWLGIGLLT